MAKIIFISGPCGCGKSTFTDAYAKHLVRLEGTPVYVIHGDDFHRGFVEPEEKDAFFIGGEAVDSVQWEEILSFNWDCILATAERALKQNLTVLIDYVIEEELPRVKALADLYHAPLYYIVLTAGAESLEKRIRERGDTDMIERSLFLKQKLETMPENQGHLYDNTGKTVAEEVAEISKNMERFLVSKTL